MTESKTAKVSNEAMTALQEAAEVLEMSGTRFLPGLYDRLAARKEVRDLCERHGYGAILQTASQLWLQTDPVAAHTVGACAGTVRETLTKARHALNAGADRETKDEPITEARVREIAQEVCQRMGLIYLTPSNGGVRLLLRSIEGGRE